MNEQPLDLAGWWRTRWGMSEAELIEALRDAKLRKIERTDYDGHYADYVVEDAEVGSFKYEVILQMSRKSSLLSRVVMRHALPLGEPQDTQVRAAFNALVKDLGAPEMLDRENHFRWSLPSTTVLLHTINLPNSLNLISIIFQPAAETAR